MPLPPVSRPTAWAADVTPEEKPACELELYAEQDGTKPVLEWLRSLDDAKRRAIGVALYEVLQHMGIAVCGTEFGKNLGHGLPPSSRVV